jgi:GABA permease
VPNPFRSEADAYRFVWLTIAYFALIVGASLVATWLGVVVFVVLTAGLLAWLAKRRREQPVRTAPRARDDDDARRILVIANETVGGTRLRETIEHATEGKRAVVLVVTPALNSLLRHWASDEDPARAEAQARLDSSLARLKRLGIDARGEVGDAEPLQAIEDALRTFGPDELIVSTHPEGRSHWLEKGIVSQARERFDLPITHVVVDLEAEREDVRE